MTTKGAFDGDAFHAALDAVRIQRGLTWRKLAEASSTSASTLTRMSQGRRPDVDSLAALVQWSGLSADDFVRPRGSESDPGELAKLTAHFRADPNLTPEAADALEEMLKGAYERLRRQP